MAISDIDLLKQRIAEVAAKSSIGASVADIVLEPGLDDSTGEFLRIVVEVKSLASVKDRDAERLLLDIEDLVGEFDERYPSVRFAEAA